MSFPKKGTRTIVVDNNTFLWKVKKCPSHSEKHDVQYEIPIQHVLGGQLLLASVGYCRSKWYHESEVFSITPLLIERCIRYAQADGWHFHEKLPPLRKDCIAILTSEAHVLTKKIIEAIKQGYKDQSEYNNILRGVESILDAGEYQIALEIIASNICDSSLMLTESVKEMITQAFHLYKKSHSSKDCTKIGMDV